MLSARSDASGPRHHDLEMRLMDIVPPCDSRHSGLKNLPIAPRFVTNDAATFHGDDESSCVKAKVVEKSSFVVPVRYLYVDEHAYRYT